MNINGPPLLANEVFITNVSFDTRWMYVRLAHAHEIAIALKQLPCLSAAAPTQQRGWTIVEQGTALAWPALNLLIPLTSLLQAVHHPNYRCKQRTATEVDAW